MLVVNKPAGMVVHPGHGHFDGTLVNALLFHFSSASVQKAPSSASLRDPFRENATEGDSASSADPEKAGILVHRIDKDTSGLLLVAKTTRRS